MFDIKCAGPASVSAETPSAPAPARVPGDPADPARCHVEDGPAISISTAQMLALGRRRRKPNAAIRRAARERVYEPEDCEERIRQYLEHAPRRTGPTLIPIQV